MYNSFFYEVTLDFPTPLPHPPPIPHKWMNISADIDIWCKTKLMAEKKLWVKKFSGELYQNTNFLPPAENPFPIMAVIVQQHKCITKIIL